VFVALKSSRHMRRHAATACMHVKPLAKRANVELVAVNLQCTLCGYCGAASIYDPCDYIRNLNFVNLSEY
jgi:hypothetical protein